MAELNEQQPGTQIQSRWRRCPSCAAFPRLVIKMMDPRTGKAICLYQCQCGERIWDD